MADSKWGKRKEKYIRSKTKSCQSKRKWKEHFKNLQRNPPEITDKPTEKINYKQLGQLMEKELDAIEKKLTAEKLLASAKYLLKYGKQDDLTT